ncbi:DEAD/DEAH box helicase [Cerasicoccus frondis]|uniref:DEAD/DEAH box helicase n=1 Tax=Cerasicoccus frondis TaxID=490090 RepID=UPI002852C210|nr:AAA domain-containing protein [Cerasicoccus frondis]
MTTSNQLAIFQELKELVADESRALHAEHEKLLRMPVDRRVDQGKCLERVYYRQRQDNNVLRFECDENLSEFREGDPIILHTGNPFEPISQGYWARDGETFSGREFIEITLSEAGTQAIMACGDTLMIDAGIFDPAPQLQRALDEMGASKRGQARVLPLIEGTSESDGVDPDEYDDAATEAATNCFNESQQDGVAIGSTADWCALIQGPPGTGKTRVLAQIVRQRLVRGERILVTACTHRAIHEALNKIHALNPDLERIAKVGVHGIDQNLEVPVYESYAECGFDESTEGYVIGATPFTAFSSRLNRAEFDCVIIDEASQMTLPLAIMAMLSADCYVVIGDEKQLPPVLLSKRAFEAKYYGLFQRLRHVNEREMLTTTYRMNHEICSWVSSEFYSGELVAHESNEGKALMLSSHASQPWLAEALGSEHSLVWIPTQVETTRHYSMEQASLVNQLMQELHRRGHPLGDVGVISPFRRQARVIRKRLRENRAWDLADLESVVVDTVERMQGQERSVIILSTAAADPRFLSAIEEFVYLPSRLNVIVSRAKVKVIVLAAENFLQTASVDDEVREAIEHWRSLREASHLVDV